MKLNVIKNNTGSDFTVTDIGNLVVIIDLNLGGRSVTNDIDNVVAKVLERIELKTKILIYRDSDGLYDLIKLSHHEKPIIIIEPISYKRTFTDLYDVIVYLEKLMGSA